MWAFHSVVVRTRAMMWTTVVAAVAVVVATAVVAVGLVVADDSCRPCLLW